MWNDHHNIIYLVGTYLPITILCRLKPFLLMLSVHLNEGLPTLRFQCVAAFPTSWVPSPDSQMSIVHRSHELYAPHWHIDFVHRTHIIYSLTRDFVTRLHCTFFGFPSFWFNRAKIPPTLAVWLSLLMRPIVSYHVSDPMSLKHLWSTLPNKNKNSYVRMCTYLCKYR